MIPKGMSTVISEVTRNMSDSGRQALGVMIPKQYPPTCHGPNAQAPRNTAHQVKVRHDDAGPATVQESLGQMHGVVSRPRKTYRSLWVCRVNTRGWYLFVANVEFEVSAYRPECISKVEIETIRLAMLMLFDFGRINTEFSRVFA